MKTGETDNPVRDTGRLTIRVRGLHRIYRVGTERIHALDHVDLDVHENEYVAVMGQSGSGKSTLMNILGCLDRPTEGLYELDGNDTGKLGDRSLAAIRNDRIGFVFQSFELLGRMTAQKNVELPLIYSSVPWRRRKATARKVLERVGLGDRIRHRPNQLSGGQKQRVAIARSLVCNPSILLADEPTGNLDTRTSDEIMALFEQLYIEGQTIIMVTHEADIARHARRIIEMRDGKIVADSINPDPISHRPADGRTA